MVQILRKRNLVRLCVKEAVFSSRKVDRSSVLQAASEGFVFLGTGFDMECPFSLFHLFREVRRTPSVSCAVSCA